MNRSRPLSAAAISAAAMTAMLLGGCAKPSAELSDVGIAKIGMKSIGLVLDFEIDNPNPVGLDLSGFAYSMSAAEETFASGQLADTNDTVAAGGTSIVRVPVDLDYDRVRGLWDRIRAHEAIPYVLTGTFDFSSMGLPIKLPVRHEGRIPPLYAPEISLASLRPGSSSLTTFEAVFDVTNRNEFDLPLRRIAGAVKYAGESLVRIEAESLPTAASGETTQVAVPFRLDTAGAARLARKLASGEKGSLGWDGDVDFGAPQLLRSMLLGEAKEPE